MGWKVQPTRQVTFDSVRVPSAYVLGASEGLGQGFKMAMAGMCYDVMCYIIYAYIIADSLYI